MRLAGLVVVGFEACNPAPRMIKHVMHDLLRHCDVALGHRVDQGCMGVFQPGQIAFIGQRQDLRTVTKEDTCEQGDCRIAAMIDNDLVKFIGRDEVVASGCGPQAAIGVLQLSEAIRMRALGELADGGNLQTTMGFPKLGMANSGVMQIGCSQFDRIVWINMIDQYPAL